MYFMILCMHSFFYYLQHSHDIGRKLHQRRAGHASVYPIDEDARPDGVRHRAEFRLLVGLLARGRQLPRERRRQPLAHLGRHGIRLHLGQFIVLVGQSPISIIVYLVVCDC